MTHSDVPRVCITDLQGRSQDKIKIHCHRKEASRKPGILQDRQGSAVMCHWTLPAVPSSTHCTVQGALSLPKGQVLSDHRTGLCYRSFYALPFDQFLLLPHEAGRQDRAKFVGGVSVTRSQDTRTEEFSGPLYVDFLWESTICGMNKNTRCH